MVERWAATYGLDIARDLCLHGQSEPAHVLRLADRAAEDELARSGVEIEPAQLLTAARRVIAGDVAGAAAFKEGRVRSQDEGSQLIAEIAAFAPRTGATRVLDACAAPGGKTLILAERLAATRIVACESSASRHEQLRQRLEPLGERVECRLADVTALPEDGVFDLVLVDAPCSGTGTLGRNPEIRHRLKPEDLQRQAERQRAILTAALRAVCPGGRVVYSTCSLEPEENEQVVAEVLANHPAIQEVSLAESIDSLVQRGIVVPTAADGLEQALTLQGAIRLLPGIFTCDGFFIAMLQRSS
jgi:16S rRNA (cytosine967-C5)-methyltransferase